MSGEPWLNVVLHRPRIPLNVGSVARTCVATGCRLHLVGPIAFDTSHRAAKRAGMDFWPRVDCHEHASWDAYGKAARPDASRLWLITNFATSSPWEVAFQPGDHVIFGSETEGLPPEIDRAYEGRGVRLPMIAGERCLNLSNTVCAIVYEAMRQQIARGDMAAWE